MRRRPVTDKGERGCGAAIIPSRNADKFSSNWDNQLKDWDVKNANISLYRTALRSSTVLVAAAAIAAPAFAQEQEQDQEVATDEVIVVTGSLIQNPNLERASPVNVTTADEIELKATNVAEQLLREIPGVVPSIGSAVNNGNGGSSFVNLRGLGSGRNLVLIDGNRVTPADLIGRFDLNNVPVALVERVEVLTGGASTTYGADAVSGVVNFLTKRDFAGVEFNVSNQLTEQGDGNYFRADVTIGANFDDGRGNATFSIGYQEADPVYQGARAISLETLESFAGIALGSGTSVPSRFSGTRPIDPVTGQPSVNPATGNGAVRQIDPATGTFVPTFQTFNFNPFNIFQTPFERFNMIGSARYEISDAVEVYTRGLFSKNTVSTIIAPSGSFGVGVNISLNNPFLATNLRNQFCAFDVNPRADIYTPRFSVAECAAAATATGPGDAAYREIGTGGFVAFDVNNNGTIEAGEGFNPNPQVALFRRTVEVGPRVSDFNTQIFDYRLGFRGAITDSIDWDISGAYGESQRVQFQSGYVFNSRVAQSLLVQSDGAGGTVCQDASNGCLPVNWFGASGTITPDQAAFIEGTSNVETRTSLAQLRGLVNGDFGAASPWAEDPILFAIGGEYRQYRASQVSDLASQSGDLGGAGGAAPNIDGGYNVYEAVAEVAIPLVQGKPGFESLTLNAGVRYSDYEVDAPGSPTYDTWTYKIDGTWEPIEGLSIRGGYSRAVRAPNINELFAPVNTGLTNLGVDPCATLRTDGTLLPGRPATGPAGELRAICLAQGATLGNIASIPEPISGQVLATAGGNLNIKPEKSDSYTVGVIVQPAAIPNFSISADYYNIKVKRAITTPTPGDVIAACFGSDVFNPPAGASTTAACTSISRDPLTGGLSGDPNTSSGLPLALSNSGSLETDGIDVSANWKGDIGFAELALSFTGNYTFNSKFNAFVANPDSINRECVGFYSTNCGSLQPEFQWSQRTTLSFDTVDVSLLWRHLSSFKQEPLDADPVSGSGPFFNGTIPATVQGVGGRTEDFGKISAYDYFDLSVRWGLTDDIALTFTVQNLFDKAPPITGNNAGPTSFNSGNTYPSTYDALGRRYGMALRAKF
jgi:outer membrane receptor protein involved in Fe transport